jgi:hypothetical protein
MVTIVNMTVSPTVSPAISSNEQLKDQQQIGDAKNHQNALTWNRSVRRQRGQSDNPVSSRSSVEAGVVLDNEPNWPTEWRAYVTLMGCFFLMFNSWGLVNAYGTFASYYKEELLPGRDILLLNLVGSTESFIVLVNSFIIGRLLDGGHARIILFVGWVFVSLGMFMLSFSSGDGRYNEGNYGLIWATQGLTTGVGMACFFVSSSQSLSTSPSLRKCADTISQLRQRGSSRGGRLLYASWHLVLVSVHYNLFDQ